MSHNIYQDATGKDCMFVVGKREDAWHQLGQRVDQAVSWEQAVKLAGLDWRVIKQANYARIPNPPHTPVETGAFTIFRSSDNAILGTVGSDYTVKQNEDCFRFIDTLLEANGGSHYDSAGALGNGSVIWCAVRVPKADIKVAGQDEHQSYLVFATSHDGSMSHTVKLTTVRVVCQNTLNSALHEAGAILRVKHTKGGDARLARVRELMATILVDAKVLEQKLNILAQRKMTRESMTAIMDRLFPKPKEEDANTTRRDNVLAEVLALYESNDKGTFGDFKGTAYNLLNAVTEYTDHFRNARITESRKGWTVSQARAENAVAGTGDTLKSRALEVIYELTDGAPVNRLMVGSSGTSPDARELGLL